MSETSGRGDIFSNRFTKHGGVVEHKQEPGDSLITRVTRKTVGLIRKHPKVAASIGVAAIVGAEMITPIRHATVNGAELAADAMHLHMDSPNIQPLDRYSSINEKGEKIANTYAAILRNQGIKHDVPFTVRKSPIDGSEEVSPAKFQEELGVAPHDQMPVFIQMYSAGKFSSGNNVGDEGVWGKVLDSHGNAVGWVSANSIDVDPTQPVPTPTQ